MYKKLVGILVITLLITTALSVVGTTIEKDKPLSSNFHGFNNEVQKGYTIANPNGDVLWDNGLHYDGAFESQWDEFYQYVAEAADDFKFEETTIITDVHWMGGYWSSGGNFDYDWNISFFMDCGNGTAPGDKIYKQVFTNAEVHKTFVEEIWGGFMFYYWVDLAEAISFIGGEKYWISIIGHSSPETNACVGCHFPVVLQEFAWRCNAWGFYPEWRSCTEFGYGNALDISFQLTGDGEPVVPDLECDGDLRWEDISPETIVNSTIIVSNNGDFGSMLEWNVSSFPDWGSNWTLQWVDQDYMPENHGFVGTTSAEEVYLEFKAPDKRGKYTDDIILQNVDNTDDTCSISIYCSVPRTRASYNTLLLSLFEGFPNAFLLIRQVLGLL
jgi:hypothetical protein